MCYALEITNLCKAFNAVTVVDDLSLTVERGEVFALLGPNGAGKSTTINMIAGVNRIDSGRVKVFGLDNQCHLRRTRQMVGVMHQELVADPFFTIDRALHIHPGFYGVPFDRDWFNLLVERLGLTEHLHKAMNCLSGGMKRRFMLAKALIHKPRLLILDEPTAGVDIELRYMLWDFVREINRHDTTIVLTTHYLEEAEKMCERVAIMDNGRLVAMDTTAALLQHLEAGYLSIYLDRPLAPLPEFLQRRQLTASADGLVVKIALERDESVCELLSALSGAGVAVRDIQTHRCSLEDVFIRLTANTGPGAKA